MLAATIVIVSALGQPTSDASSRGLDPRLVEAERQRLALVAKIRQATIAIFDARGAGGGSGVIIDSEGYALTNFHVVSGAGAAMKVGLPGGAVHDAVVVGIDPVGDVALIKILGEKLLPAATLGDSDALRLGDTVYAVGNPFLLATDFEPTVTRGIVSGLHRYQYPAGTLLEYADCIQTDASINPGNSGGPLFQSRGEVIGINGRISVEKRGRVNVGVGFAISINQIKHFLDHLRGGLIVDHATLGATVTSDGDGRVLVDEILESSDVYRRGLRTGDEIVTFGGRPIGSVNQFKNVLGIYPKGWRVELTYRRDHQKTKILTRLEGVHREGELQGHSRGQAPRPRTPRREREPSMPTPGVPKELQPYFEEKDGFANYYFNRLYQDRLLAGLRQAAAMPGAAKGWRFALSPESDGLPVVCELAEGRTVWKVGTTEVVLMPGAAEEPPADPFRAETRVLLLALEAWHRLLVDQTRWFSDVVYAGGVPNEQGVVRLALAAERAGTGVLWLFDRTTLNMVGLELTFDREVDPIEVRFGDFRVEGGRNWPHRWHFQQGERNLGHYKVVRIEALP